MEKYGLLERAASFPRSILFQSGVRHHHHRLGSSILPVCVRCLFKEKKKVFPSFLSSRDICMARLIAPTHTRVRSNGERWLNQCRLADEARKDFPEILSFF